MNEEGEEGPVVVVMAHGCFDIIHPGHVDHLKEASRMGDWLVVSITADEYVNKGPARPYMKAADRAKVLKALACVDEVAINHAPNAVPMIRKVRPDIFVKGSDYAGINDHNLRQEIQAIKEIGGRFVTTKAPKSGSSTEIANALAR